MNHAQIKKQLADYLEGQLPIEERALVDAHLDDCDACTGEVEELLQTVRLLRTLPEPEVPPMIAANVMRRIRAGESQLGFFGRIGRMLGAVIEPGFVLPASAIAAAALVLTVVQGLGVLPTSSPGAEGDASVASVAVPSSRTVQAPRRGVSGLDARDVVARVERRATQTGPQIRIKIDGLMLARDSMREQTLVLGGPVLTPRIPVGWATGGANLSLGNRLNAASPGALVVADRNGPLMQPMQPMQVSGSGPWAHPVAQSGSDPRDAWLALGFEDPAEFARYIAAQNLAEQELWAARLSERAEQRGLLNEFLQRLRESGDPTASWVADDFAAHVDRGGTESSSAKADQIR